MLTNQGARMSVDSLSPATPQTPRADFPFHRAGSQGGYFHQRRSSTASSIHSVGGALDSSSGSWASTVLETGQNAISTLLQPPIVRTGLLPHTSAPASSAHKPPTAKDIPPVPLTNIPHIDPAEFKPYISQVSALYEQLRRVKESEEEGTDTAQRRGSRPQEGSDILDDGRAGSSKRPSLSRKTSSSSASSWSQIEAPSPVRRTSTGISRRAAAQGPPPLTTVPSVYFDEGFRLENPRTFDVVSERSEVVRPLNGSAEDKIQANGGAAAPRKALATNAILQEKLSWYMDTVEMHLIASISTASTTFFSALGSLRELHSEAAESVDRIKVLREQLKELDEDIAVSGLNMVQKRRRLENAQQLHETVVQLKEIAEGVATSESLVDSGDVSTALDSLDSLERLVAGERSLTDKASPRMRLRDLRGATALQGIGSDIAALRFRVGKTYEANLLSTLVADLRRHVETVSRQEVLMRWSSASMRSRGSHNREPSAFPSYMSATDELRGRLLSNLTGLQRAKHLTTAINAYREAALKEIKGIIRRHLPSSADDDNESVISSSTAGTGRQRTQQEKSTMLARNLRAMDPEDAEELLAKIYVAVTETLRRVSTQTKVVQDVASRIDQDEMPQQSGVRSPPLSPNSRRPSAVALEAQEEIHKALDLTNLLGQAIDLAQDKIVKLLRVRAEQSTSLPLRWFLRYFTLNRLFANECESISGRSGTNLKNVVNGHIREFVQQHGDGEKKKLAQEMEPDKWDFADFTEQDTELLNQILESSTRDPAAWLDGTKIWLPYSDVDSDNEDDGATGGKTGAAQQQTNGTAGAKSKARSATIDSEVFVLPQSAILCLRGMAHFLHLMAGIPPVTADVAASLVSYLQLFNSRCTQLILGAGAMKSAGLKNITTKHLALASQSLSFIATLIPHVREFVRRQTAGSSGPGASLSSSAAASGSGSNSGTAALMAEFDKVRRLYQEHQASIYDKLIEIMSMRAASSAKTMRGTDWDGDGVKAPHAYMDVLVKDTSMLHRQLTKCLPDVSIRLIMAPVFRHYRETLGATVREMAPKTEAGRNSMIRDIESFNARLGKITGFDEVGDYLLDLVKAKKVKAADPPAPAPAAAPTPASTAPVAEAAEAADEQANGGDNKADGAEEEPAKSEDEHAQEAVDEKSEPAAAAATAAAPEDTAVDKAEEA